MEGAFRVHSVPIYRQRIDPREWRAHGGTGLGPVAEWSDRACGAAALRMILTACHQPTPSLTELVTAGVARGAYSERGWLHAGLADLATSLGVLPRPDMPRLRETVNDALLDLLSSDPLEAWGDVPVIELKGQLDGRLEAVLAALPAHLTGSAVDQDDF